MDSRSVDGSRGSLYPDLKGEEAGSLDAPEAMEVFPQEKISFGGVRTGSRDRRRSGGPIGLQIDASQMEAFENKNDEAGLYNAASVSVGSLDNSIDNEDDDDYANDREDGYMNLNDGDEGSFGLEPEPLSSTKRDGGLSGADSVGGMSGRSGRSTKSVHTSPGVLSHDKAPRAKKEASKELTVAERLSQFGDSVTRVRSFGSVHSAGAKKVGRTQRYQDTTNDGSVRQRRSGRTEEYNHNVKSTTGNARWSTMDGPLDPRSQPAGGHVDFLNSYVIAKKMNLLQDRRPAVLGYR